MSDDWLTATADCEPERLVHVVGSLVDAKRPGAGRRDARPTQAYGHAVEWVKDDRQLAVVRWGGVNHDRPGVVVPGAGGLSGFIRQELATSGYGFQTAASRVDVAMDFRHVPFGTLSALCGHPSKVIHHPDDPERGDTHYFGSRESRHFVRVYEKGKQMRNGQAHDWVRVEVEVKPEGLEARQAAMSATREELIRSGRIGRRVADAVGVEGDPLRMGAAHAGAPHDLARRVRSLRKQYGATINELAALCGEDLDLFLECLFNGMTEATLQQLTALDA